MSDILDRLEDELRELRHAACASSAPSSRDRLVAEGLRAFSHAARAVVDPAENLGVPANLRLVAAYVAGPHQALLKYAADPVPGADAYGWFHEFGPKVETEPLLRRIAVTPTPNITIGATAPFFIAPGHDYSVACYAMVDGHRAPVPSVLEVSVPPYVPPVPSDTTAPAPVAWVQGTIQNDSLVAPVLVGAPGTTTQLVSFRHTTTPAIADSGAFSIVIDPQTAAALGLPNNGPVDTSGVGGQAAGYWTTIDLVFPGNGARYNGEKAVVISSFQECLIGLMFAVNHGLVMCEDTRRGVLSYFQATDFWAPPTPTAPAPAV